MTSNNPHSNLPHINLKNHYQFVTFRTQESIDSYVQKIYHNPESDKIKQYKIDAYLDTSRNGAFLYGQIVAEIQSYFLSYDKKMYELIALSIMPNHVHILFKQIEEMRDIMRILKGGSSHIINQIRGTKGQVWAKDYFDKLVRNEKHFLRCTSTSSIMRLRRILRMQMRGFMGFMTEEDRCFPLEVKASASPEEPCFLSVGWD